MARRLRMRLGQPDMKRDDPGLSAESQKCRKENNIFKNRRKKARAGTE